MNPESRKTGTNGDRVTGSRSTPSAPVAFENRLRGKTPEEMLGIDKRTSLVMPGILASICAGVILVALTAPFIGSGAAQAEAPAEEGPQASVAAPTANPAAPASSVTPDSATATPAVPAATPGTQASTKSSPKDLLDKLGENDVKSGTPQSNPLESGVDDLLKDLK